MKKFFFSAQGLAAAALICALVSPLVWFALLPRLIGSADDCSGSRFCAGHSRHLKAPLGGQEDADIRGRRTLSLMDFPAAADAPGSPFSTRPRRLVRMVALWTPSAAILAQLSGGKGFRPQSPAAATYGLRLHLTFPQDERELKELFLAGGDDSGADVMAISLERFVALLRHPSRR